MITSPRMPASPLRTAGVVLGCVAVLSLLDSRVRDSVSDVLGGDFLHERGGEKMESGRLLYEYYAGIQKHLDASIPRIQSVLENESNSFGDLTEIELHDYLINLFLADPELQKNTDFMNAMKEGAVIIHREIFLDEKNVKRLSFSFSVAFRNSITHEIVVTPAQLIEVLPRLN